MNGSNHQTLEQFMDKVDACAAAQAAGKDALPMLAAHVVRAANEGVIDLARNKNGKGMDDARFIYDRYVSTESTKSIHDHSPGGKKANASKLRQFIQFGALTRIDPIEVWDRILRNYGRMVEQDIKVKSPYAAYVDAVRAQNDSDSELTDAQIAEAMRKPEPKDKELTVEIQKVVDRLEAIMTGEAGVKCQEQPIIDAHGTLRGFIATMVVDCKVASERAMLAELSSRYAQVS